MTGRVAFCRTLTTLLCPNLGVPLFTMISVLNNIRLPSGVVWPIPITLDVTNSQVDQGNLRPGARVALRDPQDDAPLAILTGIFLRPVEVRDKRNLNPERFIQSPIFGHQTSPMKRSPFSELMTALIPLLNTFTPSLRNCMLEDRSKLSRCRPTTTSSKTAVCVGICEIFRNDCSGRSLLIEHFVRHSC